MSYVLVLVPRMTKSVFKKQGQRVHRSGLNNENNKNENKKYLKI